MLVAAAVMPAMTAAVVLVHPSVEFKAGDTEIEVRLRCVNGVPQAEVKYD